MDYDNYYEQFNGDEVIVHLDYLEPEPSLFQQSRGRGRPTLHRELSPVRTSKQRLSRRRMSDALSYNEYYFDNDQADDFRDDDVYEQMTSRVAIQDQRYESNRSMGRQKLNSSRDNIISDRNGSGRSVVSHSTMSSRKNINSKKNKFDLTGPNADSSFEVLATLIVQHLESKVVNSQYVLDKSDMEYFDAIIPESLRLPLVEAIRIRSERLPRQVEQGESNLDAITRKCTVFGLASSDEHNFLLGGGHRVQDKIIVKIVDQNLDVVEDEDLADDESAVDDKIVVNSNDDDDDDDAHHFSLEDNLVKDNVELIPGPSNNNRRVSTLGKKTEEELPKDASDDPLANRVNTSYRNRNRAKHSNSQQNLRRNDLAFRKEEKMSIDVECGNNQKAEKFVNQSEFDFDHDVNMRKNTTAKDHQRTKRKQSERSLKKKIPAHAVIMSVYSSPSTLDTNVAAFEHEWRDGLWNVFTHGVFHPLVLLSFFAPIFALGQVMTRLKLNWIGMPSDEEGAKNIFPKFGTITLIWLVVNTSALCACMFAWTQMRYYIEAVSFLLVISNLWFYGFCVFVTGNTRRYIRDIYNIRDRGISDYSLAAMWMPFTIAQMGRHTADYNILQGSICSPTGLAKDADHSITENMNVYKSFNDEVYTNDDTSYSGSLPETSSVSLA